MRRTLIALLTAATALAVAAPQAFAQLSGEGTYGELSDPIITNAFFIVIGAIPAFIFLMSLLQWSLDRRKEKRKKAHKVAGGEQRWSGGW